MANYTSTSGSYTTTLTVTQTSQDTANNTSTLTYSLTLTKNAGSGLWNNNSCPWSITIDGTQVASGTFTYDFRNYSSLTLKSSTTTTVNHNSDGTKTVSVSASVNMNNSDYVSVMQPSGSLTLTTIPRASDVSVSNYSITNTSGSISATITSKANFYHKWRWKLGSGSWSAWANKGLISTTSSTVTVANTTLLAQLPTATSGSFNIEVATYSDSGYSNHVGTKSATCTVSVNTSNIKPSVSLGNIGLNSTPISGYAVAGHSKVQSAWSTTNSYGATSVTTYFTVSTGSLATTSSSSTSGTVVSNVIPSNASNYTLTIYAYAKDSRGAVSSTVSKSITVYGYQPPTANLSAYRTSSSSSTSEDGAGTYAYVTFSGAVRSSVNSQNTIQSTSCTYSGSISGTATNGGHYALADTQTVTFKLTVTDKVTSSTASVTIATASYPLDLYDDGNGNVGVGVGTVARANEFNFGVSLASNLGNYKEILVDLTQAEMMAYDTSLTTSSADSEWFTVLLKMLCAKYPAKVNTVFRGMLQPNSLRFYSVLIYNTSVVSDGLPQYSFGYCSALGSSNAPFRTFMTRSYNFNWNEGVPYATSSSTATTANTATSATNAVNSNRLYVSRTAASANADFIQNDMVVKEYTSEAPNIPTAHYYHTLNIMGADTRFATQLALGMTTQQLYYRAYQNSAWQPWRNIPLENIGIWEGTLKGQNGISLAMGTYRRLRVWCVLYGVTGSYEIDLTKTNAVTQVEGHPYSSGVTIAEYTASGVLELLTSQAVVNTNKNWFYHWHCGYQAGATATNKDNDNNYYIYRIDGII